MLKLNEQFKWERTDTMAVGLCANLVNGIAILSCEGSIYEALPMKPCRLAHFLKYQAEARKTTHNMIEKQIEELYKELKEKREALK